MDVSSSFFYFYKDTEIFRKTSREDKSYMRKLMSILLTGIITVFLSSCGNRLTVDNYADYLIVNGHLKGDVIYDKYCSGASGTVTVEGISDLYDYSKINLVVTVSIDTEYDEEINKEGVVSDTTYVDVAVKLNAAGSGEAGFKVDFPSYFEVVEDKTMTPLAQSNPNQYSKYYPIITDARCEVKSISGSLKK